MLGDEGSSHHSSSGLGFVQASKSRRSKSFLYGPTQTVTIKVEARNFSRM